MEDGDLAVVPKRSDSFGNEAFSTKTFEFMALGVPLLISDTAVDRYYFNDSIVTFARAAGMTAIWPPRWCSSFDVPRYAANR